MTEKPTIRQDIKWLKTLPESPERNGTIETLENFVRKWNDNKPNAVFVFMKPENWEKYRERVLKNGG